jgi:hypothetical protein
MFVAPPNLKSGFECKYNFIYMILKLKLFAILKNHCCLHKKKFVCLSFDIMHVTILIFEP